MNLIDITDLTDADLETSPGPRCPGCSGEPRELDENDVATCARCGGIFTTRPLPLGSTYLYVLPSWAPGADQIPAERTRYFDLDAVGSAGRVRRHGWFDPESRGIVQVG